MQVTMSWRRLVGADWFFNCPASSSKLAMMFACMGSHPLQSSAFGQVLNQYEGSQLKQAGVSTVRTPFLMDAICVAEAHAALAAAEWQAGHRQLAEEHFATASMIDFRWSDPLSYIRSSMRWPPRLYAAMESFLAMSVS